MSHPNRDQSPPTQHVQWLLNQGGLGDNVARLPVVKHVLKEHANVFIHLLVPDYFVEFAEHCLAGEARLFVKPRSRLGQPGTTSNQAPIAHFLGNDHTSLSTHLVDHAFHILADSSLYTKEERRYLPVRANEVDLSKFAPLPERYAVLTVGHTAEVRKWPATEVNKVALWLVGKGIIPLFLGSTTTPKEKKDDVGDVNGIFDSDVDYAVGIDLRDKTSLLEAAAIMAGAQAVCGVDNGLIHLAGTTNVPIVAGYTTVDSKLRVPIREPFTTQTRVIEPRMDLACRFCQNKYHFLYNHDFRTCYHGDLACTKQMTAERFVEHLEELL